MIAISVSHHIVAINTSVKFVVSLPGVNVKLTLTRCPNVMNGQGLIVIFAVSSSESAKKQFGHKKPEN